MPAKASAGLVLYLMPASGVEVLLGPPRRAVLGEEARRGLVDSQGRARRRRAAADRCPPEFAEELGSEPPQGEVIDLGEIRQRSGKRVQAFAIAATSIRPRCAAT